VRTRVCQTRSASHANGRRRHLGQAVPPEFCHLRTPMPSISMPSQEWDPHSPSGSGDRRVFYSPKLQELVYVSSTLEYDFALLLEYFPDVTKYRTQPLVVRAFVEGRWRESRLDFRVWFKPAGELFIEIKYTSELDDPKSGAHRQIEVQRQALNALGKLHLVVTEKNVWINPVRLNGIRTLLLEFNKDYPELLKTAQPLFPYITSLMAKVPGISVDALLALKPGGVCREVFRFALLELIRTHVIDASIDIIPFDGQSPLRPGSEFPQS
jgi:hypothetical protein